MIYLIPLLNALFGWSVISLLIYFLFHPARKINFFIFEMQGLIPKNISSWSKSIGSYVSENIVNIPRMKESLLKKDKLNDIHEMLEEKADYFLRNKLKEKIPVLSMFLTEGLITKMKEILVNELEHMVPSVIDRIAVGVEEQFNVQKIIDNKMNSLTISEIEKIFKQYAGKNILILKMVVAALGFALGWIEIWLLSSRI